MTNKPELPSSVKIGYSTYEIEVLDHKVAYAKGCLGEINFDNGVIKIDTSATKSSVANTLLHEIIHAVYQAASAREVSNPTEEYLTCMYANGLTQVFVDNPDILTFIKESCDG